MSATVSAVRVRLARVRSEGRCRAVVIAGDDAVPVDILGWEDDLRPALELLCTGGVAALVDRIAGTDRLRWLPRDGTRQYCSPLAPERSFGVGLNYRGHAVDLGAELPIEPALFIKTRHTLVPPGGTILLPPDSERVTAEGELAVVLGQRCWRATREQAWHSIAALCPALDQTAEDILQRNPRFLTRAKNYPSFLSIGPLLMPREAFDEASLGNLRVTTVHNGVRHHEGHVRDMIFGVAEVVSAASALQPLEPGDVVLTGTPGASVIENDDEVACVVESVGQISCLVARPRPHQYAAAVTAYQCASVIE